MPVPRPLRRPLAAVRPLSVGVRSHSTAAATAPVAGPSTVAPILRPSEADRQPTSRSAALRDRVRARIASRQLQADPSPSVSPHLIDTFHRKHTYLRISLTEKCNLRCTYCMPEEGAPLTPKEHLMTTPELVRIARAMIDNGVTKIRLTGGEPTVRKDVVDVVQQLGELRGRGLHSVGMTSNGIALKRKLPALVDAGLTSLNISLDTLDPFKFELITRRRGHETVMTAIETALGMLRPRSERGFGARPGLDSVKVNVVVVRGVNDKEILDFVEMTRDRDFEVRFIEYMPFEDNRWATQKLVPLAEMLSTIRSRYPDLAAVPTDRHDTTKHYQIPGHRGRVGFISSMTEHFCGGCTRLRLGADGRLKTCLFGPPTLSLLPHLRAADPGKPALSDADLMALIGGAVKEKKAKHGGHEAGLSAKRWQRMSRPRAGGPPATLAMLGVASPGMPSASLRAFSNSAAVQSKAPRKELSHIDPRTGRAAMVDVSAKQVTLRSATAVGHVVVPSSIRPLIDGTASPASAELTPQERKALGKGDLFAVARIAGIQAAKKTSDLIPLCHPLQLSHISVDVSLSSPDSPSTKFEVSATVRCEGKTGVEMEALTAVGTACLTVFDMLKAVCGEEMVIEGIKVVEKTGGKSDWRRQGEQQS